MTHVHEKELCKLIEVLPSSRFRLCQAVELNSCLGLKGFVKPAHAMFRYMTQTVLQHIIKHKSVLAISLIFFFKKKTVGIAIRVYDNGRRQYDESASHFFTEVLLKYWQIGSSKRSTETLKQPGTLVN